MKAENRNVFIVAPGKRVRNPATRLQAYLQGPEIKLRFKPQVLTRFVIQTMNSLPSNRASV